MRRSRWVRSSYEPICRRFRSYCAATIASPACRKLFAISSALRVPAGLVWEILVIDNGSTDDTPKLVQEFAASNPRSAVRLVNETRLGQGYARQRGISEAAHDIILFVDDDNWLAPDYLGILAETMRQHPEISALGGTSSACCDGPEPAWLEKYQGWYALTGVPPDRESLTEEKFLWTAGAAFRREALDRVNTAGIAAAAERTPRRNAGWRRRCRAVPPGPVGRRKAVSAFRNALSTLPAGPAPDLGISAAPVLRGWPGERQAGCVSQWIYSQIRVADVAGG